MLRTLATVATLTLLAPFTNAAILYTEFTGMLYDSHDNTESMGQGTGDNVVDGQRLKGSLTIDTDRMPLVVNDDGFGYYESYYDSASPLDWLTYEINTDFGFHYSSDSFRQRSFSPPYSSYGQESTTVKNDYESMDEDSLGFERLNAVHDQYSDDVHRELSDDFRLFFQSYENPTDPSLKGDDFLDDSVLPHEFDSTGVSFTEAYGYLSVGDAIHHDSGAQLSLDDYSFKFTLEGFALTELEPIPVSEPQTLGLFSLGIMSLLTVRLRRKHQTR